MSLDLSAMSRKELLELKDGIEDALKAAEQRERKEAIKAAEEAAAKYGFSLDEIAGLQRASGKKQKAAAKYRNPHNPEETWSGRGRKPHWVHTALTSGMDISELEI
ncbi:DNA binding protein, nucleoid-associated [Phaeobacter sp. CECT 5382]|uniref:H-NS histone family protein n=1 Tax=Phaeobacter sp. CECT 5382 TaxID=1712645 RepID=UPI0006DA47D2|nr:H-NS histone family protein [Phaeobacter sp. CECT 5382]CUH87821.1 DNA binding protein, nucleoid-associated [Phaeobacter sp. CECT 5382]